MYSVLKIKRSLRNIFLSSLNTGGGDRELIRRQLRSLLGPLMLLYKLKCDNNRFLIIFSNCKEVFEFGLQLATFFDDYGDYQFTSEGCSVCHGGQLLNFKRYEYVSNEMFVIDYRDDIIRMAQSILRHIRMYKNNELINLCNNDANCKGFKHALSAISFVNDDSNKENTIYSYVFYLFYSTIFSQYNVIDERFDNVQLPIHFVHASGAFDTIETFHFQLLVDDVNGHLWIGMNRFVHQFHILKFSFSILKMSFLSKQIGDFGVGTVVDRFSENGQMLVFRNVARQTNRHHAVFTVQK
uniref:Apical membrane antigen 1 domain protein n=1 Tax=Malacosoma sp. alphabaculovirus TaxID=1881632 RepID=A0A1B1UZM5_9ABAC|nr:hypothetical protein [Malacosoma sp. alphabaculovirus]ANW12344.1 apical membrane antigen 1 domain protein [Malacosoma sp. alphabaculovirus]